ncbi:hypothetical protein G6F37_004173 [Rhizopus arrhizus]|nr:hypothetical protein G6F38_001850 [Rhizopus arrhizus]KAG1160235.1 hypothetical protein G6F37_004173 [Rhizopus arrhizus]
MKFIIFFGLVAFIASCYAACDCAASDQSCLDKCVTSANSCVVKCQKNNSGEACEQACFVANWPSMTTGQKDMLASKTSMNSMSATSAATATPVSIMTASIPASLRTTASVARPSAGATSTPKPTVNNNSVSSAANAVSFSWITFTVVATVISFYLL